MRIVFEIQTKILFEFTITKDDEWSLVDRQNLIAAATFSDYSA